MDTTVNNAASAALPPELRALLETRDADAFEASLDALFARRQQDLFRALGHLTRDLHESVVNLTREAGQPPAGARETRRRLQEALEMTAGAAHDNLAMVERLRPQAEHLGGAARAVAAAGASNRTAALRLAHDSERFAGACLEDFTRLVEKQSWQDLSGQRLQQVSQFIDKVEGALLKLVRITGSVGGVPATLESHTQRASTQDEVDRLLSEFGF
ncbi:MAG: protein phosphatase CheZ [Xanthomonadales bacterium]|nr:protein phosphatase CheZ [Xanthomonadales bacterium]ODU95299.1 MAG: hypothetical protein ABT18_00810 [Rhodanobacter sp. SCN 66-43]OJY83025.1 MAG: hypothetical protein BGP23_08115 [Xanthomonadales bacterium 66-474]